MTEMRESVPALEPVESNSILVALQDADLVGNALRDQLGINVQAPGAGDVSRPLGLRRMNLVPPSQMSPADLARVSELAPELFALGAVGDFVLDTVLDRLREHFRERYAGWTPVIGKNRQLTQSIEGGVIIRDDEYPPSRVAAPQWDYRDPAGPGAGVRVGLLDTPFAPHPWLDGGWDNENGVLLTEDKPNWRGGHATFLTGLILRQAPGATVVIRSALNEQGVASSWDFANALAEFAASNNALDPADRVQIINISSGAFAYDGQEPLAINRALATLDPEVVVVAAAGNHGADPRTRRDGRPYAWPRRPLYPSAAAPVLAVGSAQADGRRSAFSPDVPWVDVRVRAEKVISTYLSGPVGGFEAQPAGARAVYAGDEQGGTTREFDGFASWSGTSFATALVTGAIAARTGPDVTARQAWEQIRTTELEDGYLPLQDLTFDG